MSCSTYRSKFSSALSSTLVPLLATLVAATAMAAEPPEPAAKPTATDPGYRLAAGDRVKITVYGHEDLSGEFDVDGAGRLSLPLIRDVEAAGLNVRALEEAIIAKLRPDYLKDPQVSVEVLTYRPFYIMGEVQSPGSYPYVNGMSVMNAVALAGGFTYRAKKSKVLVTRSAGGDQQRLELPLQAPVLPGDVIEVRERFF